MKTSSYLSINKNIINNSILIKIQKETNIPANLLWNIKVLYGQETIFDSGYTNKTEFTIPIMHSGKWIIFVQAKDGTKLYNHFRDSFWFYTEDEKSDYQNFYLSYKEIEKDNIPFSNLKYPYQNIAVIYSKGNKIKDKIFNVVNKIGSDLCITTISNNINGIYLVSEYLPITRSSKTIAFSGKSKYKEQFIYGQNDIPYDVSFDSLFEEIGYHSIFWGDSNYFEVTNDYFGTYPLYLYKIEEFCIISNSFHLVALLAKLFNCKLTLDVKNILPYFTTGERMLFEQLASHHSFIREIKKLPIHSKCIISSLDGLIIRNKPIGDIMQKNVPFSESEYYCLIKKSAEEIIDNINIVLNDSRIENIAVDVSGGKDSRVILGALLKRNFKSQEKRICISSKDVPKKNDKPAFIPLNHLHEYPYDTEKETYKLDDINRKELAQRSICMGTQFNRSIPWELTSTRESLKKVRLTGAGGDMLLCPYFPMSFLDISYNSIEDISMTLSINYNNGIVDFGKEKEYIKSLILSGLDEVYGNNPYEIFNNYYLYFRNVYHFGPEVMLSAFETGEEKWTPLYSKSAFLIRQMVANKYKGIKVAVDLLNELAPQLLKVPFNAPDYNKEIKKLLDSDKRLFNNLKDITVTLNSDDSDWVKAQGEKAKNRTVIKQDDIEKNNYKTINEIYEKSLKRLNKILHYDNKFEEIIGLDLYIYLKRNKENMRKRTMARDLAFLYNKITTVSDLIDLVADE